MQVCEIATCLDRGYKCCCAAADILGRNFAVQQAKCAVRCCPGAEMRTTVRKLLVRW
jgi:hypothetical protein